MKHWELAVVAYLLGSLLLWQAVRWLLLWIDRRQRRQRYYAGLRYGTYTTQARENLRVVQR